MRDMPFWTTAELAQEAEVTPRYIRQEIEHGRLVADKWGGNWMVFDEDAQVWLARKRSKRRRKKLDSQ